MDKQHAFFQMDDPALVLPMSLIPVHASAEPVGSNVVSEMDVARTTVPLVEAELLSSTQSCSSEGSMSDQSIASASIAHESLDYAYERPKFLYVMVQKLPTESAGLVFRKDHGD